MKMVAEGVKTTAAVLELAAASVVEMPIAAMVGAVLYEGLRAADIVPGPDAPRGEARAARHPLNGTPAAGCGQECSWCRRPVVCLRRRAGPSRRRRSRVAPRLVDRRRRPLAGPEPRGDGPPDARRRRPGRSRRRCGSPAARPCTASTAWPARRRSSSSRSRTTPRCRSSPRWSPAALGACRSTGRRCSSTARPAW